MSAMSSRNCSGFEIIEHSASCCLTFLKHDIYTDAEHSSLVCFLITFWITKKQHQNEILRKAVRKVCRLPYWTTFHIDIDLDVFERIDFAMTYIFKKKQKHKYPHETRYKCHNVSSVSESKSMQPKY